MNVRKTHVIHAINQFMDKGKQIKTLKQQCIELITFLSAVGLSHCRIYQMNSQEQCLSEILIQQSNYYRNDAVKSSQNDGIVAYTAQKKQLIHVNDAEFDHRCGTEYGDHCSQLAMPIHHHNQLVMVVFCQHRQKNYFSAYHIEMLKLAVGLFQERLGANFNQSDINESESMIDNKNNNPFWRMCKQQNADAMDDDCLILIRQCIKNFSNSHQLRKIINNCHVSVDEIREWIKLAAKRFTFNQKTSQYYHMLYHTYFSPMPNQMMVAEKLYMSYSTFRRHLKKAYVILTSDLLDMQCKPTLKSVCA